MLQSKEVMENNTRVEETFWHRWMTEWIPSLSARKKWFHERKNVQVAK